MRDVIVAAATPWGRSALGVVRLSGPGLDQVLAGFVRPRTGAAVRPGHQRRVDLFDDDGVFEDGTLVLGRGPGTFTGEDTAELTLHGNPWLLERALDRAVASGARLARPGEFTRRAVAQGKLDLVQAEGILQVSEAATREGVAAGRQALGGELSGAYRALREPLLDVAAELEARLDHPADELTLETDAVLEGRLAGVAREALALAGTHRAGHALVHGARVALVGAVNAGKSSLFNALVGRARALVHPSPGTTRDVLEVRLVREGLPLTLLDTAGERDTDDPVEAAGLALARELVEEADALVVVVRAGPDAPDPVAARILARTEGQPRVVVYNGVDAPGVAPAPEGALPTVATTGWGVEAVVPALRRVLVGEGPLEARALVASARQRDRLQAVAGLCTEASEALAVAGPAVAAELTIGALEELDALTGADTREAVLDTLFARFCLGK